MVEEFVQRTATGEIVIWGLSCPRCSATFVETYASAS
jgi:hypothetical protein